MRVFCNHLCELHKAKNNNKNQTGIEHRNNKQKKKRNKKANRTPETTTINEKTNIIVNEQFSSNFSID